MKEDDLKAFAQSLLPFITIIASILTGFITFIITKWKITKSNKQEIYKEQLFKVYLPIHRIIEDREIKSEDNISISNIKEFIECIWPFFDLYYILIPDTLYCRFKTVKEYLNKPAKDSDIIAKHHELIRLLNSEYESVKSSLNYPTISTIKIMSSWSTLKLILFWLVVVLMFIGLVSWEIALNYGYNIVAIITTIFSFIGATAIFLIFMLKEL